MNTEYRFFMKTTIDLSDDLVERLKRRTAAEGISMRTAVHQALRLWMNTQPAPSRVSAIRCDVGLMPGQGLTAEAATLGWESLRAMSYGPEA